MESNPEMTIDNSDEENVLTEDDLKQMRAAANLACRKDQLGRRRGFSTGGPPEINNLNN